MAIYVKHIKNGNCLWFYHHVLLLLILITIAKASEQQVVELNATDNDHFNELNDMKQEEFQQEEVNVSSRIFDASGLRRCDVTFFDLNFFFTSPNYPQYYEHNSDCIYTVKRGQNVCSLRLIFQSFDLEESNGCLTDYLEVNGQKFCGSLSSDSERLFTFTGPEIRIRFRTNAITSKSGFFIRANQLACGEDSISLHLKSTKGYYSCHQTFNQREFEINYPNYPVSDGGNSDCTYTIRKAELGICFLQITFIALDFSNPQQNCISSFLEFDNQKFCSLPLVRTRTIDFLEPSYNIHLRNIGSSRFKCDRLSLHIVQLPCFPILPGTLGPIPPAPTPKFPFNPIPTLPQPGQLCGLDSGAGYGTTQTQDMHFRFRSPGFPFPYPPNLNCVLSVRKASVNVCALQFVVESFDIEKSDDCRHDYFSVGERKFCGILNRGSTGEIPFQNDEIHIQFRSDSIRSGSGFFLIFQQKMCLPPRIPSVIFPPIPSPPRPNCDAVFTTETFEIFSPNSWTSQNGFSTVCTYTIYKLQKFNICALDLEFQEFNFEAGDHKGPCVTSYVEINGERLCGSQIQGITRTYAFKNGVFQIRFWSDMCQNSRFLIRGRQRPCAPDVDPSIPLPGFNGCNHTYQMDNFLIQNPSDIPRWTGSDSCYFTICKISRDICILEIEFLQFQLEETPGCHGQSLDICGHLYCGFMPPGTTKRYEFLGNTFNINFNSRGLFSRFGFTLRIHQISCDNQPTPYYPTLAPPVDNQCDAMFSQVKFDWTSPNYPLPYAENMDCFLTIQRNNPSVCTIAIKFNHFELATSEGCQRDYLEIFGQRYCGKIDRGFEMSFKFAEDVSRIRFHSERNSNQIVGFHITFNQRLCLDGPVFRNSKINIFEDELAGNASTGETNSSHNVFAEILSANEMKHLLGTSSSVHSNITETN